MREDTGGFLMLVVVPGPLTPYLREFVDEARELDQRRMLSTFQPNLTVSYVGGELTDSSKSPDVEEERSFVMGLRLLRTH